MSVSSANPNTFPLPSPTEMQTKFVVVAHNPIDTLLPYLLASIESIGCGSAVAVVGESGSDSGVQLTLPAKFMDMMVQLIQTYEGLSQAHPGQVKLTKLQPSIFYPPMIKIASHGALVQAAIEQLHIFPADMKVATIVLDQNGTMGLLVSGPENRQTDFNNQVLPTLQAIAREVTS